MQIWLYFWFLLKFASQKPNYMADSINEEKYRALVTSGDDQMAPLIAAILNPVGFDVCSVRPECSDTEFLNNFALIIVDGDPVYPIGNLAPAIVVISPSDQIAAYDDGADIVLKKPLEANVFLAHVRSVLRRYGVRL